MVTSCAIRDCADRTGPLGSVRRYRRRSFSHTSTGGRALRQVLDLPFRVFGKPLVERKKLLHRSPRVVVGVVVHGSSGLPHASLCRQTGKVCRTADPPPGDRSDRGGPDLVQPLTKVRVRHHQIDQSAVLGTRCTRHAQRAGVSGADGALGLRLCPHLAHPDPPEAQFSWHLECGCQHHETTKHLGRFAPAQALQHLLFYPEQLVIVTNCAEFASQSSDRTCHGCWLPLMTDFVWQYSRSWQRQMSIFPTDAEGEPDVEEPEYHASDDLVSPPLVQTIFDRESNHEIIHREPWYPIDPPPNSRFNH
jgi:hypothetical protein